MVGWEYPPHNSGGLGVACEGICNALIESHNEVTLLLPEHTQVLDERMRVFYCNTQVEPSISESLSAVISTLQNPYISPSEYSLLYKKYSTELVEVGYSSETLIQKVDRYKKQAIDVVTKYDFDVIHAHDWLCFGAGIALQERTGKPFIVHIHATEFDRGGGQGINQYVYQKELEGFHKADKIIAVSSFTKEIVAEKYGISHEKIEVVHNGVTLKKEFTEIKSTISTFKQNGYSVVLYLGRITIQKGVEYLIKSAQKILTLRPKTVFIIAGSGDMETEMIELAARLGISDSLLFAGFVRGREQERLLRDADVLVMPSVSEPFGIVPLEAIAQGTPVVISKESGVAEVVTHALKVNFWDVDEMAHQVVSILEYPALSDTLQKESFKQLQNISWKNATDKIVKIYHSLIHKK